MLVTSSPVVMVDDNIPSHSQCVSANSCPLIRPLVNEVYCIVLYYCVVCNLNAGCIYAICIRFAYVHLAHMQYAHKQHVCNT